MMNSLVLIPWPETAWSQAGRITSRTPVPLTDAGRRQAHAWGTGLASSGLGVVYSGEESAATETARIVAEPAQAKHKALSELAEVDAGLWDGLTAEELKLRDPRVFKRWCEDPSGVCPPEGEDLSEAYVRLRDSLAKLTGNKRANRSVAVVLGPLAFGVARCVIESAELANVRSMMHHEPLCYRSPGAGGPAEPVEPMSLAGTGDTGCREVGGGDCGRR